jgi:hypothetical protein
MIESWIYCTIHIVMENFYASKLMVSVAKIS